MFAKQLSSERQTTPGYKCGHILSLLYVKACTFNVCTSGDLQFVKYLNKYKTVNEKVATAASRTLLVTFRALVRIGSSCIL